MNLKIFLLTVILTILFILVVLFIASLSAAFVYAGIDMIKNSSELVYKLFGLIVVTTGALFPIGSFMKIRG